MGRVVGGLPPVRQALALLLAAGLLGPGAVHAAKKGRRKPAPAAHDESQTIHQAQRTLEEKKRRAQELQPEIRQREREERTVLVELDRRDHELATLRGEIRAHKDEIAYTEAQLAAVRTRQRATTGELARSHEALGGLLRTWQAEDGEGLAREVSLWHGAAQADRLSSARLTRFELLQSEARQSEYLAHLTGLRRDLAAKERQMEAARRRRRQFLDRVRLEKFQKESEVRELAEQRRNLERVVDRYVDEARRRNEARRQAALHIPSSARVGQLVWPVRGAVVRPFGRGRHEEFNAAVFSTGIEIRAAEGSPVRAAAGGRVAYSDWLQGYGRVMIVDHGSNFYTLYGHLEEARMTKDMPVERGAVLGTVGDTGTLGTPTLYFEVRRNGRPADPLPFLGRSAE